MPFNPGAPNDVESIREPTDARIAWEDSTARSRQVRPMSSNLPAPTGGPHLGACAGPFWHHVLGVVMAV